MTQTTKNVFISHIHEDDAALKDVKDLLKSKDYIIRDSSIHSGTPNNANDENYIKTQILAPGINWASTIIVVISPNTHTSEWVNWEIEYAEKQGKRIVGVWLAGAKESDLPEALKLYADAVVGWHGDRIVGAIEGTINNWTNADGTERTPLQIPHYSCQ